MDSNNKLEAWENVVAVPQQQRQKTSEVTLLKSAQELEKEAKIAATLNSINKLNFDSLALVGRKEEISTLKEYLQLLTSDGNGDNRQLVLLGGHSGTGKTTLAHTLRDPVRKLKGCFVSGKYDQKLRDQPYSGIGAACDELCQIIAKTQDARRLEIRRELALHIDRPQLELLEDIIPNLTSILYCRESQEETEPKTGQIGEAYHAKDYSLKDVNLIGKNSSKRRRRRASDVKFFEEQPPTDSIHETRDNIDHRHSRELLKFAFGTFIRIITSHMAPLVLLLDDLQWADLASLEILQALMKDRSICNLLVIGCYRSNEVDETHIFSKAVQDLREGVEENTHRTMEMEVGNLSQEAVKEYIMDLLSISDSERASSLSKLCHKRTLGNAFFIKVFLMMLNERGLLHFSIGTFQWNWDDAAVERESSATDNVVGLIKSKMDQCEPALQLMLQVASCLGNTFDANTVTLVWENIENALLKPDRGAIDNLLLKAVEEMFFESVGGASYRFVHDKVQEAAMSLTESTTEFESFQYGVGRCLLENLDEKDLEKMIFVVVDLLNKGNVYNVERAILNARAAAKAKDLSAFTSAVNYVECGIRNLQDTDMWKEHPRLTLELHSIGAEAESSNGNDEKSSFYCREVQRQSNISSLDKMRVNRIMVERLYSIGKHDKAWIACLDILDEMGCSFPRNKTHQRLKAPIYMLDTLKKYLPSMDEIENAPFILDAGKRETIGLMVAAMSYNVSDPNTKSMYTLLSCRCIRWTKKYGLSDHAASAFSSFANVMMHRYGDWRAAVTIAELARQIQKRLDSNFTKTSTLQKTTNLVLGWVRPLKTCVNDDMEAYRLGMLSGNIEGAGAATLLGMLAQFYSGTPLRRVAKDLTNYVPQMERLKQDSVVYLLRLNWQTVLNFLGDQANRNATVLIGTALDDSSLDKIPGHFNVVAKHHVCYLCTHFGEYVMGAGIALEMGDIFPKTFPGLYFGMETFPRAMCLYAAARETKLAKYAKAARPLRSRLEKWVKLGGVNFVHQLLILNAEDAALEGDERKAGETYKKAIVAAAKAGSLQDVGLANERYAWLFLCRQDYVDAQYHVKEAIRYYSEWGASRKVESLREKHAQLLST